MASAIVPLPLPTKEETIIELEKVFSELYKCPCKITIFKRFTAPDSEYAGHCFHVEAKKNLRKVKVDNEPETDNVVGDNGDGVVEDVEDVNNAIVSRTTSVDIPKLAGTKQRKPRSDKGKKRGARS